MGQYVICHKEGGYLAKSANDKWERVSCKQRAAVMTREKANNVLNNCIAPVFRSVWEIRSAEEQDFFMPESKTVEEGAFDWEAIAMEQHRLYSSLTQYGEDLNRQLSTVDLEICDIQHYIEFFALDAAKGYKAYKMLRERLERRRSIKDEIAKVHCLLGGTSADFSTGKISRQIKGMDDRKYTPRVLNELFGLQPANMQLKVC